jgi:serine/threonine-protein kinase
MKIKGPFVTLLGGLAVAGVLFGLSVAATNRSTPPPPTTAAGTGTVSSAPASTAPAAPPSTPASAPIAPPAVPVTFAGRVAGGAASIAIAVREGRAVAYVCDGKSLESWLQGPATAGQMSLTGTRQAGLTATYDGAWATGTVTVAGKAYTFRVESVQAPSGLYRASANVRNAQVVGGWIVKGGETVGMVTPSGGTGDTAPPIDTATGNVTIDGTTITAGRVDGTTSIG